MDWFLKMNPGEVGRVAFEFVKDIPNLEVAASSLTLLPEARAVRNSVFIRMLTGEAVLRLNSSVESTSSTLSTDHWGILRFSGGFARNWCLAKRENASASKSMLKASRNGCRSLDL